MVSCLSVTGAAVRGGGGGTAGSVRRAHNTPVAAHDAPLTPHKTSLHWGGGGVAPEFTGGGGSLRGLSVIAERVCRTASNHTSSQRHTRPLIAPAARKKARLDTTGLQSLRSETRAIQLLSTFCPPPITAQITSQPGLGSRITRRPGLADHKSARARFADHTTPRLRYADHSISASLGSRPVSAPGAGYMAGSVRRSSAVSSGCQMSTIRMKRAALPSFHTSCSKLSSMTSTSPSCQVLEQNRERGGVQTNGSAVQGSVQSRVWVPIPALSVLWETRLRADCSQGLPTVAHTVTNPGTKDGLDQGPTTTAARRRNYRHGANEGWM